MPDERLLKTIEELSLTDGTSGHESAVREYIIKRLASVPDCEYRTDALGNLIVFRKGRKPATRKVMLDAHMDEVGVIATFIESDGFIRFACVGGIVTAALLGKRLRFANGTLGVVGVKPIHLIDRKADGDLPEKDSLYIDIGASSREEAYALVKPGDTAVFDSGFVRLSGNRIKGKALDDRVGCAIMLDMIEKGTEYDAYFSFSVQEEVGLRGAGCAAYGIAPDYAVVLESTTAGDLPDVPEHKRVCALSGGACVSFMDRTTVYSEELFKAVFSIAEDNKIRVQPKTAVAGGNDAGSVHRSREGVRTVTLNVPCRYIHSASSVCDIRDIEEVRRLAELLADTFANAQTP